MKDTLSTKENVKFIVSLQIYHLPSALIAGMKVTVAVIEDAFLDLQRLDHAGVVICYTDKESGTPTMMIPGKGVSSVFLEFSRGNDRNLPLKRNFEGSYIINVKSSSCHFFDCIDEGMLGMIFNGAEDPKLLTLFILNYKRLCPSVCVCVCNVLS